MKSNLGAKTTFANSKQKITTQLFFSSTNTMKEKQERRIKMSKLRIFIAAIFCLSLLTFAGCGENNNSTTNDNNGTVTEETTDMNGNTNDSTKNGTNGTTDDSVMDDMERDAKDMVDGLEDDAERASDKMRNGINNNSRSNDAIKSTVGQ